MEEPSLESFTLSEAMNVNQAELSFLGNENIVLTQSYHDWPPAPWESLMRDPLRSDLKGGGEFDYARTYDGIIIRYYLFGRVGRCSE